MLSCLGDVSYLWCPLPSLLQGWQSLPFLTLYYAKLRRGPRLGGLWEHIYLWCLACCCRTIFSFSTTKNKLYLFLGFGEVAHETGFKSGATFWFGFTFQLLVIFYDVVTIFVISFLRYFEIRQFWLLVKRWCLDFLEMLKLVYFDSQFVFNEKSWTLFKS